MSLELKVARVAALLRQRPRLERLTLDAVTEDRARVHFARRELAVVAGEDARAWRVAFALAFGAFAKAAFGADLVWKVDSECPGAVWPDLAKFRHFGKTFYYFGKNYMVHSVFGKVLNLLWKKFYSIGRIIIILNDLIMKIKSNDLVTLTRCHSKISQSINHSTDCILHVMC